ncbi:MAG: PilZ domain-containing protein [Phycisphaerales bacterium]|nr:PilZ domain-containing protein [Phycisphaerales bacterium]
MNGHGQEVDPLHDTRRTHHRKRLRRQVTVSWLTDKHATPPTTVATTDISQGGIGFLSRKLIHLGTIGIMLLTSADNKAIMRAIKVVRCDYEDNMMHRIGAQWDTAPPCIPLTVKMTADGPTLVPLR